MTVAGPAGWALFAGVIGADTLVSFVLHAPGVFTVTSFAIIDLNTGPPSSHWYGWPSCWRRRTRPTGRSPRWRWPTSVCAAADDLRRAIGARLSAVLTLSRRTPVTADALADIARDLAEGGGGGSGGRRRTQGAAAAARPRGRPA
ncbi:hypothetical protein GCM10020219_075820 [Nonomuraea dietziae]